MPSAWNVSREFHEAAFFGYAYLYISRVHVQFASWPDVPVSLPGIILVASGTAVGAQVVTSTKGCDDVKALQEALAANGFTTSADGVYGAYTDALVTKWQKSQSITENGVGPLTRKSLKLS